MRCRDWNQCTISLYGVICWGKDVEDACWKMENTDAFCQTVSIATQIGGQKKYGPDKLKELIELRRKLGMPDHRLEELKECELCDASDYTVSASTQTDSCACSTSGAEAEVDEAVVQKITDLMMEKLK